jgi:hypothetical protein
MRVQQDSFADNEVTLLLPYPEGRQSLDVPRELLPEYARAGDGFEASFAHDRRETRRMAAENRRLLGNLLGRDGG